MELLRKMAGFAEQSSDVAENMAAALKGEEGTVCGSPLNPSVSIWFDNLSVGVQTGFLQQLAKLREALEPFNGSAEFAFRVNYYQSTTI